MEWGPEMQVHFRQKRHVARLGAAAVGLVIALAITGAAWAAVSGSSSVISGGDITGSGTATVELALSASAETTSTPTDVFIIMDASGSVGAGNFETAKDFANDLVTALDGAGLFTNGGRIGLIETGAALYQKFIHEFLSGLFDEFVAIQRWFDTIGTCNGGHFRRYLLESDGCIDATAVAQHFQ